MKKADVKVGSEYAVQIGYGRRGFFEMKAARCRVEEVGVPKDERSSIHANRDHTVVIALEGKEVGWRRIAKDERRRVLTRHILGPWPEYVAERDRRQAVLDADEHERRDHVRRAEAATERLGQFGVEAEVDSYRGTQITLDVAEAEKLVALLPERASS